MDREKIKIQDTISRHFAKEEDTLFKKTKSTDVARLATDSVENENFSTLKEKFSFNNQVAAVFDDMAVRSIPNYREMLILQARWAQRTVKAHELIYDLGCSTGSAIVAMLAALDSLSAVRIIGIDYSEAMIEKAQDKIARFLNAKGQETLDEIENRISIQKADLLNLSLETCSFVGLNFVLQFIAPNHREEILARISDSLRPGGVFFFSEKICSPDAEIQAAITEDYEDFKHSRGYSREEILSKKKSLEGFLIPSTESEYLQTLEKVGFTKVFCVLKHGPFASWVAIR